MGFATPVIVTVIHPLVLSSTPASTHSPQGFWWKAALSKPENPPWAGRKLKATERWFIAQNIIFYLQETGEPWLKLQLCKRKEGKKRKNRLYDYILSFLPFLTIFLGVKFWLYLSGTEVLLHCWMSDCWRILLSLTSFSALCVPLLGSTRHSLSALYFGLIGRFKLQVLSHGKDLSSPRTICNRQKISKPCLLYHHFQARLRGLPYFPQIILTKFWVGAHPVSCSDCLKFSKLIWSAL